jgi:hypothetical protein
MSARNLSPEAKAILAKKVVVPIVGISSVGKNTLMDHTVGLYEGFHRVSGFTTRGPKTNEPIDTYREYLPNTPETRQAILDGEGLDECIQSAEHGELKQLYGTMLQDYAGTYNLKDTLSSAVDTFRDLGFAACNVVVLVADPEQWQRRFDSNDFDFEQGQARIAEGKASLNWALGQNNNVNWLVNPDGKLDSTAASLRQLAIGRDNPRQIPAKQIGIKLLAHLDKF